MTQGAGRKSAGRVWAYPGTRAGTYRTCSTAAAAAFGAIAAGLRGAAWEGLCVAARPPASSAATRKILFMTFDSFFKLPGPRQTRRSSAIRKPSGALSEVHHNAWRGLLWLLRQMGVRPAEIRRGGI